MAKVLKEAMKLLGIIVNNNMDMALPKDISMLEVKSMDPA